MVITIAGGGSTFTAGIVKSIALRREELEVDEIRLFDINKERQDKVAVVVDWVLHKELNTNIKLVVTTDVQCVIDGLGGKENILSVDNCFTRLRVNIKDPAKLDEAAINKLPNSGIVKKGTDIQIVYGLQVADIKRAVEAQLENQ